MEPREVVQAMLDALNSGDWDSVASYLSNGFQFSGPVPEPVGAAEWVGLSRTLQTAFPDINYNLRIVSAEGNVVKTKNQLTSTHTGDLDLSALGMGVIPATGKSFSNPEEEGEAVVAGDKITSLHVHSTGETGLTGILAQIGVEPPAM